MGPGLQPCGLSTASTSCLRCPLPAGVGHQKISKGGAALAARCPSDLLWFYLMAPSRKLASRLEVGERENPKALGEDGLMQPASPPPLSLPRSFRFLQFVKLVIIFLGAFFLFFKCKVYLYSVFKVVKKKIHKTKPRESSISLSVGIGCDN